jgi:hypothetical protein
MIDIMSDANRPICIFCGRSDSKMSKEHVLPHHWKKTFPSTVGKTQLRRRWDAEPESKDVNQVTPYDAKVSRVCVTCNGGWMRLMDESIKPLIHELALGTILTIPAEDTDRLASWCTKVSLLQTHTDREAQQEVPTELTRKYFVERRPMDGCVVQLGKADNSVSNMAGNISRQLIVTGGENAGAAAVQVDTANVVTFRIGAFVFQVGLPTASEWSLKEVRRILAASRVGFPNKIVPLRLNRNFEMPTETLRDNDVVSLRDIAYEVGRVAARKDNRRLPAAVVT